LPEKIINSGDPYQYQCEQTAKKIADKLAADLDIDNLDWQICYQSRVGPLKWIGPSVEEALQKAASDNKPVIIYPHAFTQEHVETLVELDIEYRHLADQLGLPGYYRAQTVGTGPAFITALARLVNDHLDKVEISAEGHKCLCPENFTRCCMRKSEDIKMKKAA
jgi:ferrochelatase